ncbi:hypothetical protein [Selenomonas sp. AB3002]|uniref:hypothetical protein n=1 Tax=Selenomonas sp. AB3002 TaxID=1392502 RepID=UPI000498555B
MQLSETLLQWEAAYLTGKRATKEPPARQATEHGRSANGAKTAALQPWRGVVGSHSCRRRTVMAGVLSGKKAMREASREKLQ